MSTLTNFNVKVPINPAAFPATDSSVIWDASAGAFDLGTIGSSGITVATDPDASPSSTVNNVTTLTFKNGKITGTTPNIEVDSIWFNNDALDFGNLTGLSAGEATAGFVQNGTIARTHVTPQRYSGKISLLAIPGESTLLPYPDNYIVYTSVSVVDEGEATSYCYQGLFNFNVVTLNVKLNNPW